MLRLYSPRVFATAALLILGAAVSKMTHKIELPPVALGMLLVVCFAGLIGTLYTHGSGRLDPLPPGSADESRI